MKNYPLLAVLICIGSWSIGQTPQLFTPISTPLPNRDIAISPDGQLMLTTVQSYKREVIAIAFCEKNSDGSWSQPKIAPFSGKHSDLEPAFSPDGKRLYFASNRPTAEQPDKTDYDLWFVEQKGDGWAAPVHLPAVINTEGNEFYPSVTHDGSIYYTATYENEKGKEDIYVSRFENGEYQAPKSLSEHVNSATWEFNAFVAADESYIIFTSFGREDDLGGGDLYISKKGENGAWLPAIHLPDTINSSKLDYCPFVDHEGKFYFTSSRPNFSDAITYPDLLKLPGEVENGLDNIYVIEFDEVIGN